MGGITIILGYNPIRFVRLDPIKEAEILVATPKLELGEGKTKRARALLPESVPLSTVVRQMSSFASLILGLMIKNPKVTGQGISGDIIVEPARAGMIPSFFQLKKEAISAGAYGFSISGAGPSVFALCPVGKGESVGRSVKAVFSTEGIDSSYSIHNCSGEGAKVVS